LEKDTDGTDEYRFLFSRPDTQPILVSVGTASAQPDGLNETYFSRTAFHYFPKPKPDLFRTETHCGRFGREKAEGGKN